MHINETASSISIQYIEEANINWQCCSMHVSRRIGLDCGVTTCNRSRLPYLTWGVTWHNPPPLFPSGLIWLIQDAWPAMQNLFQLPLSAVSSFCNLRNLVIQYNVYPYFFGHPGLNEHYLVIAFQLMVVRDIKIRNEVVLLGCSIRLPLVIYFIIA